MHVKFLDLEAQHNSLQPDLNEAIQRVIRTSSFIKGSEVINFEKAFSAYLNVKDVISCANGTDALEIVLDALEIGVGDEVIVPALSWISTSEVVATRGALPVFIDIDPQTYCIDTTKLLNKISSKTKAIIAVHLYGHPADLSSLSSFCKKYKLNLIEDCAQAHGAEYEGEKAGSFGTAATFSFFPSKNLGCMGDGGAIATDDSSLGEKCRIIANHGQVKRHQFIQHGRNSRLDGLQAAVLNLKIPQLDGWVKQRNRLAKNYHESLSEIEELQLPIIKENCFHAFHLFVVQSENRNGLKKFLKNENIESLIHYPKSLPEATAYNKMNHAEGDYSTAKELTRYCLSLPLYPEMPAEDQNYVIEKIIEFYKK